MSSCISGGGRAFGFDIEMIKSPSTCSSITSNSSSILSESSNSPIAISTRKPRTPRKRPNQTYNEAAALLSTAYPKIFSTKHLTKPPSKFTKLHPKNSFFDDSAELLLPFPLIDNSFSGILLHQTILENTNSRIELKSLNSFSSSSSSSSSKVHMENDFQGNCCDEYQEEDFDTESMLDEEIEEGIDSIMGNLSVENEANTTTSTTTAAATTKTTRSCYGRQINTCYGYPMGLGFSASFDFGFGMRRGVRALRQVDEGDWWRFPSVETPMSKKVPVQKKKKKVEKLAEIKNSTSTISPGENSIPEARKEEEEEEDLLVPEPNSKLLLKLNYDDVLNAWSDRGSPFPDDISGSESSGNDIHARLSQIDLFSEGGGVREASVLRYKEKRRTRLFSKKIRYQVRKVNADRRPRMKGRFVRRPNSPMSRQ